MALSLSVGREDNVAFIDATVLFMAFLRTATSETELARATSLIPVNWAMVWEISLFLNFQPNVSKLGTWCSHISKRGSVRWWSLRWRERAIISQTNTGTVLETSLGKASHRRGGSHMSPPEHVVTILNWTERKRRRRERKLRPCKHFSIRREWEKKNPATNETLDLLHKTCNLGNSAQPCKVH